jgi:hypothetical protein
VAWEKLKKEWGLTRHRLTRIVFPHSKEFLSLLRWVLVRELKLLWGRFKQSALGDTGALTSRCDEMGAPLHWALVERIYSNAVKDYHLHRLDSRGVLFRADPLEERPARALDETLGWKDLFGKGLEIISVSGDHLTMMERPTVRRSRVR